MRAQARHRNWLLAAALAMCCGAAAQDTPEGVQIAPQETRPTTTSTRPDADVPEQAKQIGTVAGVNQLDRQDRDLTFLPELRPTDGVLNLAQQRSGDALIAGEASAMHGKPILLDRAVAVINGEVLLASDVREQQEFAIFEIVSVPGDEFTPMQAMQQIVNRTLLLEQMQEQQLVQPPTDAEVDQQIDDLRKHIPACDGQHCETAEGWKRFLAAHGFTEAELHTRWKERMQILRFIEVRFRTGIRIARPEVETYYKEQLLPEFAARKLPPPPLARVYDRIDEILLQQHVNVLLNDYLRSLKDAGSVLILDPAYNELGNATSSPTSSPGGASPGPPARTGVDQ